MTVYYGDNLCDSEVSDWEDPEDAARREYVEQYNFDLLEGMKLMVFVPSTVPSRADRRVPGGAYLYDGNNARVNSDESIVDRERETWSKYCASSFGKGLAPFPSDAAASPPTFFLRRNGRCLEVDCMDMVPPEHDVDVREIDHTKILVSDEDDEALETVMPSLMEMPVLAMDSGVVSEKEQTLSE